MRDRGVYGCASTVSHYTPVRISLVGSLNGVDVCGLNKENDDKYVNAASDETRRHIDVTIQGGLGVIRLESA